MIPQEWTISGLAVELAIDRRTLAKRLTGLPPIREQTTGAKTTRFYRMADVFAHFAATDALDLDHERAILVKLQQERLRLDLAEARGELVRAPVIGLHWQAMVAAMRAVLLGIPGRVAPLIAAPTELPKVTELLRDEVHAALEHIAGDGFPDEVRKKLVELRKEEP